MRILAYLDICPRDEEQMNICVDKELCAELGLTSGQKRPNALYRDLYWSFQHNRVAFGFGDLSQDDLNRIYDWIIDPGHHLKIFTGWDQHHGTPWQVTIHPMVRASYGGGITRPYHAVVSARFGGI
jgi:hypothetical protein